MIDGASLFLHAPRYGEFWQLYPQSPSIQADESRFRFRIDDEQAFRFWIFPKADKWDFRVSGSVVF